jgi:hypothetical protein
MLLNEIFSPVGGPDDAEQDINWIDDLEFFINTNNNILEKYIFPAIKKHEKHIGHPQAFKLYLTPIKHCAKIYCQKYDVEDQEKKFSQDSLTDLAKHMATQQEKYIQRGDYKPL